LAGIKFLGKFVNSSDFFFFFCCWKTNNRRESYRWSIKMSVFLGFICSDFLRLWRSFVPAYCMNTYTTYQRTSANSIPIAQGE
ncbi:hypothetical protein LINPERHAP1_LOCUS6825, partial [Linum perenne]